MNAAAIVFAVQLARLEAESALPTAPVVAGRRDGRESGRRPVRTARFATARALRQAADLLAPAPRVTCG